MEAQECETRPAQCEVKKVCKDELQAPFPWPVHALAVDNISMLAAHESEHCGHELRGVLYIRVENDNPIPSCLTQAGSERELMAMVSRKVDTNDVRVLRSELVDALPGLISRSIVYEDDLVGCVCDLLKNGREVSVQLIEDQALVKAWDHR